MALKLDLIPTVQTIPNKLGNFLNETELIEWSTVSGGNESSDKNFDSGHYTNWRCDKTGNLREKDIWALNDSDDTFELQVQEKNESFFIAYFDLDVGRHFRTFTSMGFEHFQDSNLKGSIHLNNVGREYKKLGTNDLYSHSCFLEGDDYKNKRDSFYTQDIFDDDEIRMQDAGFVLNRIYFHFRTSSSGGTSTGKQPPSEIKIFNLRFGWGKGRPSTNHRICLPKKRPFAEAQQLIYGD